ncbi:MAG: glycosyltransferase [Candidatus Binatia bacterium]
MKLRKAKISVLFVVGGLPYGGIENLLLDLLRYLDKSRFNCKVINLSGKGVLTERFLEQGVEVLNLGFHLSTHRLDNTWRLRRLFVQLDPDVVFTSQFAGNHHARLAALGLEFKVITQVHNTKRERYWERRLSDRLLGRWITDHFIAVSRGVQKSLKNAVPASAVKTTLIYNAVGRDRLALPPGYSQEEFREREGVPTSSFLVTAVGRLVYQKGFDILLSAFQRVVAGAPDVFLLLAGDGELFQQLDKLIDTLSLRENVRLLGYRRDVSALLSASDAFVLPSRWEGFSIVALEAMALGVPTVLTESAPNSEVIHHGHTGWVVTCKPDAIADGILSLYRDAELRCKLAENEKALFQSRFSAESYARKVGDLIWQTARG